MRTSLLILALAIVAHAQVSVIDYGADPTGDADSAPAFQAAHNHGPSDGWEIEIPAGAYRLGSTVEVWKPHAWMGTRNADVILDYGVGVGFDFQAHQAAPSGAPPNGAGWGRLESVWIYADSSNTYPVRVRAPRFTIRNVGITGGRTGIRIESRWVGCGGSCIANANGWRIDGGDIWYTDDNGIWVSGDDSNGGLATGTWITTSTVAVSEGSLLGNTWSGLIMHGGPVVVRASSGAARPVFSGCYAETGSAVDFTGAPSVLVVGGKLAELPRVDQYYPGEQVGGGQSRLRFVQRTGELEASLMLPYAPARAAMTWAISQDGRSPHSGFVYSDYLQQVEGIGVGTGNVPTTRVLGWTDGSHDRGLGLVVYDTPALNRVYNRWTGRFPIIVPSGGGFVTVNTGWIGEDQTLGGDDTISIVPRIETTADHRVALGSFSVNRSGGQHQGSVRVYLTSAEPEDVPATLVVSAERYRASALGSSL